MNKRFISLLFAALFAAGAWAKPTGELYNAEMEHAASVGDDLTVRILAIWSTQLQLDYKWWSRIRRLLHQHPAVGWDLLWRWDHLKFKSHKSAANSQRNQRWDQADQLMAKGDFSGALRLYSPLAALSRKAEFGTPDFFAHESLLHSQARAYYGAGQFDNALKTYQQISLLYPFVRQIQFEKMWAAFRANNFSLTLGAIASQLSSYFSRFLEPETYLVQYYIYRRLCRQKEMDQVLSSVRAFRESLDKKNMTLEEWAGRELDTMLLLRLTRSDPDAGASQLVNAKHRREEIEKLRGLLKDRYQADMARIKDQVEKVVAYLNMATVAASSELPAIPNSVDPESLLNPETEMWTVEDAEDWLDEVGHHHFIGRSECK
jgi:hypothetical protein